MKIDLSGLLTIDAAVRRIGCSRRAFYRMKARAVLEGRGDIFVEALGRTLVRGNELPSLRKYYLPVGSKRRSLAAKKFGRMGGNQKRINREKERAT